jgi:hypothetical protein
MNPREQFDQALRDAAVPEPLIPNIAINENMREGGDVPFLQLPDGWDPHTAPDAELVREAVYIGVGLSVTATEDFDVAWLGEDLKYLRWWECDGDPRAFRNWDALTKMESLVVLRVFVSTPRVDVSHLDQLLSARIHRLGLISAAGAPRLKSLTVDGARIPSDVRFTGSLENLNLEGEVDAVDLSPLQNLTGLSVSDAPAIDLTPLGGLRSLRTLSLWSLGSVSGVRALSRNKHLRELYLYKVRSIIDPEQFLALPLSTFSAEGCPSLDERFKVLAEARPGDWSVTIDRRARASAVPNLFEVEEEPEGGYVISFSEWPWLDEQLGLEPDTGVDDSQWVERLMLAAVRKNHSELIASGAVAFDSESDEINILCHARDDATAVADLLRDLFTNKRRLRSLARTIPRESDDA